MIFCLARREAGTMLTSFSFFSALLIDRAGAALRVTVGRLEAAGVVAAGAGALDVDGAVGRGRGAHCLGRRAGALEAGFGRPPP